MRKLLEDRIDEILLRTGARDADVQIALADQTVSRVKPSGKGTRTVKRTVYNVSVDDAGAISGRVLDKAEGWRPVIYDYDAKRWRPGEYPGPDKWKKSG